jgi:hypothetical protein
VVRKTPLINLGLFGLVAAAIAVFEATPVQSMAGEPSYSVPQSERQQRQLLRAARQQQAKLHRDLLRLEAKACVEHAVPRVMRGVTLTGKQISLRTVVANPSVQQCAKAYRLSEVRIHSRTARAVQLETYSWVAQAYADELTRGQWSLRPAAWP